MFKDDKKQFYKKLNGRQAVFRILKQLHFRISNSELKDYFTNKFREVIEFNLEIEKLYDAVFACITLDEFSVSTEKADINKLRSKIYKLIEGYNFNLEKYYEGKYELDLVLSSRSFCSDTYSLSQYTSEYLSCIHLINTIIEIVKFKADRREITGVDIIKNTVKYRQCDMMYDILINSFRTKRDEEIFETYLDTLISHLMKEFMIENNEKLYFDTLDKIDDCIRLYKDTVILVDIVNQRSSVKLEAPNFKMVNIINDKHRSTATIRSVLQNRDKITSPKGVTLVATENDESEISSLYLKDTLLNNKPYIVCSYNLKKPNNRYNLTENTIIIPVKISSTLLATSENLIEIVYKFYNCLDDSTDFIGTGMKCEHEVISHEYWKYRKSNFIAPQDETGLKSNRKPKRYFEVEIGVHTARMGNASEDAIKLAKTLGIQLKQGETLVRNHTRRYGKELLENEKQA